MLFEEHVWKTFKFWWDRFPDFYCGEFKRRYAIIGAY